MTSHTPDRDIPGEGVPDRAAGDDRAAVGRSADRGVTGPGAAGAGQGIEELGDGLVAIDTWTAGIDRVTAGYLIRAPRPVLVECGPALSVDRVLAALDHLGMGPDDLAHLVVSHIHLDHAGGAGDVLAAFPSATVVVSEVGARHLVDPGRLNASSRRVYGELMDTVYGDCTPIDVERVRGVGDGAVLELGGGRRLDLLYTPGHAKHHIAAVDSDSGALFVGDSVGVRMPGMTRIRPATPPPDFDLDRAFDTLSRYRRLDPTTVYLAHYGAVDPPREALAEAEERLRLWVDTAEAAWQQHAELDHIAETLAARFSDELATPVDGGPDTVALSDDSSGWTSAERDAARLALLSGYRSNAMGLKRWFETREQSPG